MRKGKAFYPELTIAESEPPPSVLRQKLGGRQRRRKLCRRKERLRYALMEGVCGGWQVGCLEGVCPLGVTRGCI